ncbi:MAG: peptidylprolyl isomerase [Planctomycetota bacterium]|nr:peptidylprolyl isomerase [Planctomycetota bacterium]
MAKSIPGILVPVLVALGVGVGAGLYLGGQDGAAPARPALQEVDKHAYAVSTILFRVEKNRSPDQTLKLARLAYEAVAGGARFEDVARARSEQETAQEGGFLGFVPPWHDTAFAGAVQTLRPGEISPPLRTPIGFQVIKRHSFEEARELEQRYRVPAHGVFIRWAGLRGGPEGRTKEQARELAMRLRDDLARGRVTLTQAAERYALQQERRPEAYIGMITDRPQSHAAFTALSGVEPGAIIGPLESKDGYGVFVRGRYLRSLVRHIVVQHLGSAERDLRITRTRPEALAVAERALKEVLADRSRWDEVVGRYSDDQRTQASGGTMGVLDPGTIPDGFQQMIYDLPPDTIHDQLVETPFGFHIVWKVN